MKLTIKKVDHFLLVVVMVAGLLGFLAAPTTGNAQTTGNQQLQAQIESLRQTVERLRAERTGSRGSGILTPARLSSVNLQCLAAAIDARERNLMSTHSSYNNALLQALETRRQQFQSVINYPDGNARHAYYQSVWNQWRNQSNSLVRNRSAQQKQVWDQYYQAVRTNCRITPPPGDPTDDGLGVGGGGGVGGGAGDGYNGCIGTDGNIIEGCYGGGDPNDPPGDVSAGGST